MNISDNQVIRIAILDMYDGFANEGMRCIRQILNAFSVNHRINIKIDEFEIRQKKQIPDLSYDIFISTGGPGSPLDSKGSEWETNFFDWLNQVKTFNSSPKNIIKKHIFFICHSFQLVCRYYDLGNICKRKSPAFGVFPIHMINESNNDPILQGLRDPFYAVDSRDYQFIQPNHDNLNKMGCKVLAIEKERPHVPYERAVMAIRFNDYFFGTQFHPEADAAGMSMYLKTKQKKKIVIENHGEEKWHSMIEQLNDPDKILHTYNHILPNFLRQAINHLKFAEA